MPWDAWLQEKSHYNLAISGKWYVAAAVPSTGGLVFQQSTAGWPQPGLLPWAMGWGLQRGGPSLSKHFCPACVTWEAFSWLWKVKMVPFPTGCSLNGSGEWLFPLHMAFLPQLPESRLSTCVPTPHSAQPVRMKRKQITVVAHCQSSSLRKLSQQKLSMSPVQSQKSKQSRNGRWKTEGRSLWKSVSGQRT